MEHEHDTCDLTRFESFTAQEVLNWASKCFGRRLALVTSFQVDGMVMLDMAHRDGLDLNIVTVDTGRLPQETHDLIDLIRARYNVEVRVFHPEPTHLEDFVRAEGMNSFYRNPALRLRCCEIRKVYPLRRALASYDAWVSGVRRDHSANRAAAPRVEIDRDHGGIFKINPLADWTEEQVWEYVRKHDVPTNSLYRQGYSSIGCAPCTRAIRPGEDPRAGRWWWEGEGLKECGIHPYAVPDGAEPSKERVHAIST
jgi:phosphoadenosine phosphosulfate reductase